MAASVSACPTKEDSPLPATPSAECSNLDESEARQEQQHEGLLTTTGEDRADGYTGVKNRAISVKAPQGVPRAVSTDTCAATFTTMKDLAPLVAMPPPSIAAVTNRLSNQTYSRLGRNLLFEARPAVRTLLAVVTLPRLCWLDRVFFKRVKSAKVCSTAVTNRKSWIECSRLVKPNLLNSRTVALCTRKQNAAEPRYNCNSVIDANPLGRNASRWSRSPAGCTHASRNCC